MLYELRTYTLMVGAMARFEDHFAEALPHREKYSKMAACWHTEIGPLNQIVHLWPYDDLDHRARVRAEAAKDPNWPPSDAHLIVHRETEILAPAPFMRPIEPGHYGNIYEMRYYTCTTGSMPEIMEKWSEMMEGREKYSPLLFCGYTDIGQLEKLVHIWPYEDMAQRTRIREEVVRKRAWPPKTSEFITDMKNKLLVPSHFSPVH